MKGKITRARFKDSAVLIQYKKKNKKIRVYSLNNDRFLIQILRLKRDIGGEFAKSIDERGLISGSLSLTKETFYELAFTIGRILEEIEE